MIYNDGRNPPLLLNPYADSLQKLSRLNRHDVLLLQQLRGRRKIKDIYSSLQIGKKEILSTLKKWSGKKRNILKFLDAPITKTKTKTAKKSKEQNIIYQLRWELNSAQASGESNDLKKYHEEKIRGAMEHFEHMETTVSHLYKKPHILLGGKNYGEAFADTLIKKGAIRKGINILEIGGGTGIFGKSFLDEIKKASPKVYKNIRYTFFEISPSLIGSQRKKSKMHPGITKFIRGDIQNYDFGKEKFDLVISNEMIADLDTVKVKKNNIEHPDSLLEPERRAVSLIKRYKIDTSGAQEDFLFNLGAIELLRTIKNILKTGGKAYVIEYGSDWAYPRAVHLKGHAEYSIHFGFLVKAAKKLKLNPRLSSLVDFLPFNKKIKVVDEVCWSLMNDYLLPFLNLAKMAKGAYTEDMLKKEIGKVFDHLSFIRFSCVGSDETLITPAEFYVLSLE